MRHLSIQHTNFRHFVRWLLLCLALGLAPLVGVATESSEEKTPVFSGTVFGGLQLETATRGTVSVPLSNALQQLGLRESLYDFEEDPNLAFGSVKDPKITLFEQAKYAEGKFVKLVPALKAQGIFPGSGFFIYSCHGRIEATIESVQYDKVTLETEMIDWNGGAVVFNLSLKSGIPNNWVTSSRKFDDNNIRLDLCPSLKIGDVTSQSKVLLSKHVFFQPQWKVLTGLKKSHPMLHRALQRLKPKRDNWYHPQDADVSPISTLQLVGDKTLIFYGTQGAEYVLATFEGHVEGDGANSLVVVLEKKDQRYRVVRKLKNMATCIPTVDLTQDGVPDLMCFYPYREAGIFETTPSAKDLDPMFDRPLLEYSSGV